MHCCWSESNSRIGLGGGGGGGGGYGVRVCLFEGSYLLPKYHPRSLAVGDTGFQKGGGGPGNCTKMQRFRAHKRNVFPLFMKVGGPPKGGRQRWGGGGGGSWGPWIRPFLGLPAPQFSMTAT